MIKKIFFTFIISALIALSIGITPAYATIMSNSSVYISDPRPSQPSVTYTISWKAASSYTIKCIKYDFDTTLASAVLPTGMDTSSAAKGAFTNLTASNWTVDNTGSATGVIKLTYTTGETITATTQYTTEITTITNPSSAVTYWLRINTYTNTDCTTGSTDTMTDGVATTSAVTVSATISQSFTFTVGGLGDAATIKGAVTTEASGCTNSATVVTFPSSMSPATNYTCGQSLTVSTNAAGGYTVYTRGIVANDDLVNTLNGTYTITDATGTNAAPTAWGTPAESFGYTTSDATLGTGTAGRFSADDTWAKWTNANLEVAYSSGPVTSEATYLGFRVRFATTTEEGTYQGTVLHTAVPIF